MRMCMCACVCVHNVQLLTYYHKEYHDNDSYQDHPELQVQTETCAVSKALAHNGVFVSIHACIVIHLFDTGVLCTLYLPTFTFCHHSLRLRLTALLLK